MKDYQFHWRGIDWRTVERIEGRPGASVTVHFEDGTSKDLTHYPGEATFQRATHYLNLSEDAS